MQKDTSIVKIVDKNQRHIRSNLFARLKHSLLQTKENLSFNLTNLFSGKQIDDDIFEQLEEKLLLADIGSYTTHKIISSLSKSINRKQLKNAEVLYDLVKHEIVEILLRAEKPLNITNKIPFIILIVGTNGAGKTTTIGKLAYQYKQQNKSVMLAAGDTFRAAAVEQLKIWGQYNNIPVIAQRVATDPAAVIFDAIQSAKSHNVDILIADTAGRLQNKLHLMEELKKIVRVIKKIDHQAPHEIMLILDANTGQNTINQVKMFHESINITGITLTKLDGTAKGGIIVSVADQFSIPIRYIGIGKCVEDLRQFSAIDFVKAILP